MNVLMLLVGLRLAGARIRLCRVVPGAAFGACAALMARRCGVSRVPFLWALIAIGMMSIAAGRRAWQKPVHHALCLLSAGGLLGGVVLALFGATGSLPAAYLIGCVCALWIAALLHTRRGAAQQDVFVEYMGVRMRAMIDSGNTLRDYLTHRPVIVLPEKSKMARQILEALPLRPIFADTAGGRQMMRLAMAEGLTLQSGGRRKSILAAVALAPGLDVRSPALVPPTLFEEEEK